jgi:hypothetical protein
VLTGKFHMDSNAVTYSGTAFLVAASIWNWWPRRVVESCGCKTAMGR